ncbi:MULTISPECIES: EamA family transporter [Bacillaceae]|uniref:EamA family transporter n=1 Tax=Bacillaceae TaxID=186817 RepID=UPI002FFE592B
MWIVAAFITMVCFGMNNTIFKWSTAHQLSKIHIQLFFYFTAFLLSLGYGIFHEMHISLMTIILGGIIGVLNANGNIQMSKAFENGPASLTSPLIGTNTIFPILTAGIIFHEHISAIQWLGIVFMMGSAILIQYSPGSTKIMNYRPWILRVILSIFSFGLLGILMKTTSLLHISSLDILISMYGGGSLYLGICSVNKPEEWKVTEVKVGILVGLISLLGYSSYFYALQTGTASIVFPIVSLNCLVVVFAGIILFKEKLRNYQVIGVLTALLGIIFTKI